MTPRQRLVGLVSAAADLADNESFSHAAFVLGQVVLALIEGRDQELAAALAEIDDATETEAKALSLAELFPGVGRG